MTSLPKKFIYYLADRVDVVIYTTLNCTPFTINCYESSFSTLPPNKLGIKQHDVMDIINGGGINGEGSLDLSSTIISLLILT